MYRSIQEMLLADGPWEEARRFVLIHGRPYRSARLGRSQQRLVDRVIRSVPMRLEQGWCMRDCAALVTADDRFRYVEGYYHDPYVPMFQAHAWVTLDGVVVDPQKGVRGRFKAPVAYWGIEFSLADVDRHADALRHGLGVVMATLAPDWPEIMAGARSGAES